jgi:hypothetical protein
MVLLVQSAPLASLDLSVHPAILATVAPTVPHAFLDTFPMLEYAPLALT